MAAPAKQGLGLWPPRVLVGMPCLDLGLCTIPGGLAQPLVTPAPHLALSQQYRAWIRRDYGRNPFKDQEELQRLLALQEQGEHREGSWAAPMVPTPPLPPSRSRRMSS